MRDASQTCPCAAKGHRVTRRAVKGATPPPTTGNANSTPARVLEGHAPFRETSPSIRLDRASLAERRSPNKRRREAKDDRGRDARAARRGNAAPLAGGLAVVLWVIKDHRPRDCGRDEDSRHTARLVSARRGQHPARRLVVGAGAGAALLLVSRQLPGSPGCRRGEVQRLTAIASAAVSPLPSSASRWGPDMAAAIADGADLSGSARSDTRCQ